MVMTSPEERSLLAAIRREMKRRGWSQATFARKARVSQSSLSRLLSGKTTSLHAATENRLELFLASLSEPASKAPGSSGEPANPNQDESNLIEAFSTEVLATDGAVRRRIDEILAPSRENLWLQRRGLAHGLRRRILDNMGLPSGAREEGARRLLEIALSPESEPSTRLISTLALAKSSQVKNATDPSLSASLIELACDRNRAQHPQMAWTVAKDADAHLATALLERHECLSDWSRARLLLTLEGLRHDNPELEVFNSASLKDAWNQCRRRHHHLFEMFSLWENSRKGARDTRNTISSAVLDSLGLSPDQWELLRQQLAQASTHDPTTSMAPMYGVVGLIARGELNPSSIRYLLDILAFEIDAEANEDLRRGRYDRFSRLVTPTLLVAKQYDLHEVVFDELAQCHDEGLRFALIRGLGLETSTDRFWDMATLLSNDVNEWVVRDTLKAVSKRLESGGSKAVSTVDRTRASTVIDNAARWSLDATRRGGGYEVEVVDQLVTTAQSLSDD